MNRFGIPAIDERFDFVRLLGNLFLLPPDAIKAYIEDNALARVDLSLLRPYLMQRSDWGTFTLPGLDDVAGQSEGENETADGIITSGGRVLKERLATGRLASMMRELESLKIGAEDFKGFSLPAMPSIPSMQTMQTMSGRVLGTGGLSQT